MNDGSETKILATSTVSTVADLLAFLEDSNLSGADLDTIELAFPVVHLVEETSPDGPRTLTLDIDYDEETDEGDETEAEHELPAATD
jgi:hypothetical protein